jgi:hypothetical protein
VAIAAAARLGGIGVLEIVVTADTTQQHVDRPGWTELTPGSRRRVPVAVIRMLVRKSNEYVWKRETFYFVRR